MEKDCIYIENKILLRSQVDKHCGLLTSEGKCRKDSCVFPDGIKIEEKVFKPKK